MDPILPTRRGLTHWHPAWIREDAIYFITICCARRHANQLCRETTAALILESVTFRQNRGDWYMHLLLLMPDHLHALVSFPRHQRMSDVIEVWKGITAKRAGIAWQIGYFDHRLRNRESYEEKASYIRLNPVRAGLIDRPQNWPYVWEPNR